MTLNTFDWQRKASKMPRIPVVSAGVWRERNQIRLFEIDYLIKTGKGVPEADIRFVLSATFFNPVLSQALLPSLSNSRNQNQQTEMVKKGVCM